MQCWIWSVLSLSPALYCSDVPVLTLYKYDNTSHVCVWVCMKDPNNEAFSSCSAQRISICLRKGAVCKIQRVWVCGYRGVRARASASVWCYACRVLINAAGREDAGIAAPSQIGNGTVTLSTNTHPVSISHIHYKQTHTYQIISSVYQEKLQTCLVPNLWIKVHILPN